MQDKVTKHDAFRKEEGIMVHRIKGHIVKRWGAVVDPRISWRVNDVIKKNKFEIIHVHSIYSPTGMVTAYTGKTLRNIPTLATNHSLIGGVWVGSFLPRLLREGFTRLDALIAISSAVKNDSVRLCADKPVFVVPSGVDCNKFYPDEKNREKIRESLGFRDNDIVIVTVGRLVPRKRMHELIQILPDILKRHRVKLLIIGDGPEKNKLMHLSKSLNVDEHMRFAGYVSNPADFLNASDIFALCSVDEALGISILEAMACELPVVVKDVNGIKDILNGNNRLPRAEDAVGIKKNIELLIADEDLRKKIARNNRNHVLSNFAWDSICENILQVYSFVEHASEMDARKYYNMKLAKLGRIVKRLMLCYEKNRNNNNRY